MKYNLILFMITFIFLGTGCDHVLLERDNALDPKNPDSKRDKTILVEVFVNNNIANSAYSLEAAEKLMEDDYSGKLVLLEYHIHNASPDAYSAQAVDMLELLDRLDLVNSNRTTAVPDIYINGFYEAARDNGIQGASSVEIASNRLGKIIDNESGPAYFTIEGSVTRANPASINVTIARLGKSGAYNCKVKAAIIESYDENYHKYVVRDLMPEQALDIGNGSTILKTFQSSTLPEQTDINRLSGVVWIEDADARALQSALF